MGVARNEVGGELLDLGVQEISTLTPALRSDLVFRHQQFRDEGWYIAQDPVTCQFHRFGEGEYRFLRRLDGRTSVRDALRGLTSEVGEETLTLQQAVNLLRFLRVAQLIAPTTSSAADKLYAAHKRVRRRRLSQKLSNFLFITIPIIDPDRILTRLLPYARPVLGPWFLAVWFVALAAACVMLVGKGRELADPIQGLLAPDKLFLMYVMFLFTKLFHETWHGLTCKRFGGAVHEAGILFLVLTPAFYVDASSAWRFPSRWQRMYVALAGLYIELFLAAVATMVWVSTQPGVVHSLAYNVMFLASVSALLFNGNPLLRYDAYYVLTDLLEMPNLWLNSNRYLKYLASKYLLGVRTPPPEERASTRACHFVYGVSSFIYRVFVVTAILWFISGQFLELGLLLGFAAVVNWLIIPGGRLIRFALCAEATRPVRLRSAGVTLGGLAAMVIGFGYLNAPLFLQSPCAVSYESPVVVRTTESGWVRAVRVRGGMEVDAGALLATLDDPELETELAVARADLSAAEISYRKYEPVDAAAALAEAERIDALTERVAELTARVEALAVRAPAAGTVLTPSLELLEGRFLEKGSVLLNLGDRDRLILVAAIPQEDAYEYRNLDPDARVEAKLRGTTEHTLEGHILKMHPRSTREIPHIGLTDRAGGPLLTDPMADKSYPLLLRPHFLVEVGLDSPITDAPLRPGALGVWRVAAPARPLLSQWYRALLRKIQARVWL